MRRLRLLVAAFAVALPALLAGTAVADDAVTIRSVELRDFPRVRLIVSMDEQSAVSLRDVTVEENGVPVHVLSVDPLGSSGELVDAVLAIDVSNSMQGPELETALAAAQTFVDQVPSWLPVGLLSFADQPVVRAPVTLDRALVETAVATLGSTTVQGTALYEAVVTAASMFDPAGDVQHNLILLTDGKNTQTTGDLEQAVQAAMAANVTVYTIALTGSDVDEETLRALAIRTGGQYASITTDDLEAVYAGLARGLSQQFVVTYRSKAPLGAPVSVTVGFPAGTATARFLAPSLGTGQTQVQDGLRVPVSAITSPTAIAVIAALVFLAVLNLTLLVSSGVGRRRREIALRSRLVGAADPAGSAAPTGVAGAESNPTVIPRGIAIAAERAAGAGVTAKLGRRLHQAGWALRSGEFLIIVVFAALALAAGGFLVVGPVGALLGLPGVVAPFVLLSAAAGKRLAAIQGQLADTLMVIASSLRAGHSFLQSLDTATKEIGEPGASEFGRTMTEVRFGRDVDSALDGLAERVGSRDLEWAVTAIKIQRKIGGNLAEVLEGVAKTIRERETLRRQVRVLSAEGRISAVVLTVLPILIALYLTQVNPDYLRVLTESRIGLILISVAVGLMLVGYLWMQKIVKLDDV